MRGGDLSLRPVGLEHVKMKDEEKPVGGDQGEASSRPAESG